MKPVSLFAATTLIAASAIFAACGGGDSGSAKPSEPASEAAASQPEAAAEPADATPSGPVEITDAMVTSYIEYQKENFRILQEYAEKTRKNLESGKGDVRKALQQVSIADQYSKEIDDKLEAKRRSLGLSGEQFEAVKEAAQMTANLRLLYKQAGGDEQLAQIEAAQKAALEGLPEAERAAAKAEADEMVKAFANGRDLAEVREKYGDKSADVLLRRADELAAQQLEFLQFAGKQ